MAGSLNKVQLIGNLGADPEVKHTKDNRPMVNLSIATSDSWKDKNTGERRERTEWHRVVIFSEGLCRVAEQYLRKGSKVFIEGQLQTRKWQDDRGADRYSTEVVMQGFNATLLMLDSRGATASDSRGATASDSRGATASDSRGATAPGAGGNDGYSQVDNRGSAPIDQKSSPDASPSAPASENAELEDEIPF